MKIRPTELDNVFVVDADKFIDRRGVFTRCYCEKELSALIGNRRIVQVNLSRTLALGAVRGLHFQHPPYSELKLVRCIKGRVWDVAVDLRASSHTFLRWQAVELSSEDANMIVIPEGYAHGFQTLEADSELMYLHTAFYEPTAEGGILYNDPSINIQWPVAVTEISDRDRQHPCIGRDFQGIRL